MKLERARQIVLGLVGLIYFGLLYPLCSDLWHSHWLVDMHHNECEPMFLSFYVGLGLFLLLAARRPAAHRSLIVFAAWSSLLHSLVMTIQTVEAYNHGVRRDYMDVVVTAIFGVVLLVLIPPKEEAVSLSSV